MANKTKTPLKIVQRPRKMVMYQVSGSEMENIGALTGLEQIFLNALFAGIGAIIGTGTALLSPGQSSLQVQVVFWASLAVSAVVLVCFIVVKKKRDKLKNDITG